MRGSAYTLLSTIHLSNGIFHDAKHSRCTCTLLKTDGAIPNPIIFVLNFWLNLVREHPTAPTKCQHVVDAKPRINFAASNKTANVERLLLTVLEARAMREREQIKMQQKKKLHAQAINISSIHVVTWQRRVWCVHCMLKFTLGSLDLALCSNS